MTIKYWCATMKFYSRPYYRCGYNKSIMKLSSNFLRRIRNVTVLLGYMNIMHSQHILLLLLPAISNSSRNICNSKLYFILIIQLQNKMLLLIYFFLSRGRFQPFIQIKLFFKSKRYISNLYLLYVSQKIFSLYKSLRCIQQITLINFFTLCHFFVTKAYNVLFKKFKKNSVKSYFFRIFCKIFLPYKSGY